jgi:hypothetical protein
MLRDEAAYSAFDSARCMVYAASYAVQVSMLLDEPAYSAFDSDVLTVAEPSVWTAVQVSHLDNPFEYGVVHSMSSAIARNKVPILYQSTFSKAATLVEMHHLETATMALTEAGWRSEQLSLLGP